MQDRRLPDRRDLNRSFPGSRRGSLTARLADTLFREVIRQSDFGIDLHTGGRRAHQLPADPRRPGRPAGGRAGAAPSACPLVVAGAGPEGSLRRTAVAAGCRRSSTRRGAPAGWSGRSSRWASPAAQRPALPAHAARRAREPPLAPADRAHALGARPAPAASWTSGWSSASRCAGHGDLGQHQPVRPRAQPAQGTLRRPGARPDAASRWSIRATPSATSPGWTAECWRLGSVLANPNRVYDPRSSDGQAGGEFHPHPCRQKGLTSSLRGGRGLAGRVRLCYYPTTSSRSKPLLVSPFYGRRFPQPVENLWNSTTCRPRLHVPILCGLSFRSSFNRSSIPRSSPPGSCR